MTVIDLLESLSALGDEYLSHRVVIATDPEGNSFRDLDEVDLPDLIIDDKVEEVVCIWPGKVVSE